MEIFLFGIFGLIIGSFLNVLILREATGEGIGGRSHCNHCAHQLESTDLIPLVSWIALKGRCRYCAHRISLQYPLVEATTAGLFMIIGASPLSLPLQALALIIVALFVAITVYDIQHMLIPDAWSYGFSLAAGIFGIATLESMNEIPLFLIAGFSTSFPLWALWAISHGRWMGFGDVKLAVGIGWLVGLYNGFNVLLGAFVIGAAVSIFILLPLPYYAIALSKLRRLVQPYFSLWGKLSLESGVGFTIKSEVPFGPFLITSCLIVWLCTIYGVTLGFPW